MQFWFTIFPLPSMATSYTFMLTTNFHFDFCFHWNFIFLLELTPYCVESKNHHLVFQRWRVLRLNQVVVWFRFCCQIALLTYSNDSFPSKPLVVLKYNHQPATAHLFLFFNFQFWNQKSLVVVVFHLMKIYHLHLGYLKVLCNHANQELVVQLLLLWLHQWVFEVCLNQF